METHTQVAFFTVQKAGLRKNSSEIVLFNSVKYANDIVVMII